MTVGARPAGVSDDRAASPRAVRLLEQYDGRWTMATVLALAVGQAPTSRTPPAKEAHADNRAHPL